jgi:hypothetical protein
VYLEEDSWVFAPFALFLSGHQDLCMGAKSILESLGSWVHDADGEWILNPTCGGLMIRAHAFQ